MYVGVNIAITCLPYNKFLTFCNFILTYNLHLICYPDVRCPEAGTSVYFRRTIPLTFSLLAAVERLLP